ncbi:hypothetical protein [Streptacidiphilus sp. EB103A]|uniref:hypothetical protein n=1 Tax=Streptacidiphilus sp. EB103A TaxID=3156275 RepID=UPI00351887F5
MSLWVSIITASSGLLGAVIGVTATLFGERSRARAAAAQEERQAAGRLRMERKAALMRFFELARSVERLAERRFEGQALDFDQASDVTSNLWLCNIEVRLICSVPVSEPIYQFAQLVTDAVWESPAERIHVHLGAARSAALSAARVELEPTGTDLQLG